MPLSNAERALWRDLESDAIGDIAYWQNLHRVAHQRACHAMRHGDFHGARLAQLEQAGAHFKARATLAHLAYIRDVLNGAA